MVEYDCMVKGDESFDPEGCADSDWAFKAFYEPGNAPVSVSVQSRKRPQLEEVLFRSLDDNVDNFLNKEELTGDSSILKQMDVFDPDGDGKISLEELKGAIAKLEEQKGRKLTKDEVYGFFGGMSPGEGVGGAGGSGGPGGMGSKGGPQGKGFKGKGKKGKRPEAEGSEKKKD